MRPEGRNRRSGRCQSGSSGLAPLTDRKAICFPVSEILGRAEPRIDSTDSRAEKGMVSLSLMRPSFVSSSPVSGGFLGGALILMKNGAPDSAKPWPVRSLSAVLRERALARFQTLLIAVPAAAETGPQR